MRILDMSTFVALARHQHFGRAAQEMHTTQPAISIRLAAMEQEFGCRLMHRTGREFSLTPAGERVLETFQAILASYEGLKQELADDPAMASKVVRIGAIDSVSSTWMTPLVESLHATFPTLKIELTVEGTKSLIQGMNEGAFDVIFAVDPAIGNNFRSFTACILQMIWAGSPRIIDPKRTYSVDDLSRMPIIGSYQATAQVELIRRVVEQARLSAAQFCATVDPAMAWVD